MIVILYDDMGNVAEFDLKKGIPEFLSSLEKPENKFKTPFKDSKSIKMDRISLRIHTKSTARGTTQKQISFALCFK